MPSEQDSIAADRAFHCSTEQTSEPGHSSSADACAYVNSSHEHFRPLSGVCIAHGLSGLGKLNYQEATWAPRDRRCSIGPIPAIYVVTMSSLLMLLDQGHEKCLEE